MSIATRTGDDGTTGLLYGQRVPKDHPQIEAVGACDELNVALGAARLHAGDRARSELLIAVQRTLVAVMGELACAEADAARFLDSKFERVREADLERLDAEVRAIEARRPDLAGWATPGANGPSVALEQARVIARRAERRVASLPAAGRNPRPLVGRYLNRLSDVLWLMAREAEGRDIRG